MSHRDFSLQPDTPDYNAFYRFVERCKDQMETYQTGFRQCPQRASKLRGICFKKWTDLSWDEKKQFYTDEEQEMVWAAARKKPNKRAPKDRQRKKGVDEEDVDSGNQIKGPPIAVVDEGEYDIKDDLVVAKKSPEDDCLADSMEQLEVDESNGSKRGLKGKSKLKTKVVEEESSAKEIKKGKKTTKPDAQDAPVEDPKEPEDLTEEKTSATKRGRKANKPKVEPTEEDAKMKKSKSQSTLKTKDVEEEKAVAKDVKKGKKGPVDPATLEEAEGPTEEKSSGSRKGRKTIKPKVDTEEQDKMEVDKGEDQTKDQPKKGKKGSKIAADLKVDKEMEDDESLKSSPASPDEVEDEPEKAPRRGRKPKEISDGVEKEPEKVQKRGRKPVKEFTEVVEAEKTQKTRSRK